MDKALNILAFIGMMNISIQLLFIGVMLFMKYVLRKSNNIFNKSYKFVVTMVLITLLTSGYTYYIEKEKNRVVIPKPLWTISQIEAMITEMSTKAGLPTDIMISIAKRESFDTKYRPGQYCYWATSKAGAQGLFQFMPNTFPDYCREKDSNSKDPVESTYAAIKYIKHLQKKHGKHNWPAILSVYNSGSANGRHKYTETKNYVAWILKQ